MRAPIPPGPPKRRARAEAPEGASGPEARRRPRSPGAPGPAGAPVSMTGFPIAAQARLMTYNYLYNMFSSRTS